MFYINRNIFVATLLVRQCIDALVRGVSNRVGYPFTHSSTENTPHTHKHTSIHHHIRHTHCNIYFAFFCVCVDCVVYSVAV